MQPKSPFHWSRVGDIFNVIMGFFCFVFQFFFQFSILNFFLSNTAQDFVATKPFKFRSVKAKKISDVW